MSIHPPEHAPAPSDRILIVGAGPAGLHMALALKDRGFERVVVYEAGDRIGGKCLTVDACGAPFDLGAGVAPLGSEVESLCQRFGVGLSRIPLYRRDVTGVELKASLWGGLIWRGLQAALFPPLERLIARTVDGDPLSDPGAEAWQELALPLSIPLGREASSIVQSFCNDILFIYGYGSIHSISTWYGLEFLRIWLRPMADAALAVVTPGYQRLWETVAAEGGLDVRLGRPVESLEGGEGGVIARLPGGEERFDFAINSAPHRVPGHLPALFSRARSSDYLIAVAELDGPRGVSEGSRVDAPGRVNLLAAQGAIRAGRPVSPEREAFSLYSVPDHRLGAGTWSLKQREQQLRDSLRYDFGYDVPGRFAAQQDWLYFPRFSEADLRQGAPAQVWRSQGAGRIWSVGAVASMESVPNVLDYNLRLLAAAGL